MSGDGLIETGSDVYTLASGEVRLIPVPMAPSPELTAGRKLTIDLSATWSGRASSKLLKQLESESRLAHPLLRPPRSTAHSSNFTVVQLTDTHIERMDSILAGVATAERLQAAIEEINLMQPPPAFVIVTGDFSHNSPDAYPVYHRIMSRLNVPFLTVFGNHDKAAGLGLASRAFSEWGLPPYYAFHCNGQLFVVLDTVIHTAPDEKGHISSRQLQWLRDIRTRTQSGPSVFFSHHSLLPDLGIDNAEEAQKVLATFPGPIWSFVGHWHCDLFINYAGQHHVFTTTTAYGMPLKGSHPDRSQPGYRLIRFEHDGIRTEFKPLGSPAEPDPAPDDYATREEILKLIKD